MAEMVLDLVFVGWVVLSLVAIYLSGSQENVVVGGCLVGGAPADW